MENVEVKFMTWVNDNYEDIKSKLYAYCNNQKKTFDEDIFQDTIIKIYDKIERIDKNIKLIPMFPIKNKEKNIFKLKIYKYNWSNSLYQIIKCLIHYFFTYCIYF